MCISSIADSSMEFQTQKQQFSLLFHEKDKNYQPFTPAPQSKFGKLTDGHIRQAPVIVMPPRRYNKRVAFIDPPTTMINIPSQKQNGQINEDWIQKILQKKDLSQLTYMVKKNIQNKIKKMNVFTICKLLEFFFSRIQGKIKCSLIKSIIKQSFTTVAILQGQQDSPIAQINDFDYLVYQTHPQNHYLYKKRQISKAFYYILRGQVKLEDQNKISIFIRKQGQVIGSHQLLTHQRRKLSAVCLTNVGLLAISRKDYQTKLEQQILKKISKWSKTIQNISFFNNWDQATTIKLIGKKYPTYLHFRHILFKQGQLAVQTFIVLEGQFKLTTKLTSGKMIQSHKIAPFCLGQQNLIQQCHSATAMVASQRCKLIRLQRQWLKKKAKAFNLQSQYQQTVSKIRQYTRLRKIQQIKQNEKDLRVISQQQLRKYNQDLRLLTKDRVQKNMYRKQIGQQYQNSKEFIQTFNFNKASINQTKIKRTIYFTPKKQRQYTSIQQQQRIFRRISLSRKKKRSSISFNQLLKHLQNKHNCQ